MAKLNDQTVVDWMVNESKMSPDRAWSIVTRLLDKEKEGKEPPAKAKRKEWLVVVADPNHELKDSIMGFVVQKSPIKKDLDLEDCEEERMWGDLEADSIMKAAFARVQNDVKGTPTFVNCLRAAKKLLKEEYGFEVKSKEGCYIAPIDYQLPEEEDEIL